MIDTVALREKVLDLAIRGKLVPQDPNDEPASVLLDRIRAQKQQMVKDGKLKAKDIKDDSIIFVGEDNLHYEKFADGTVECIEEEIPFNLPIGWSWERLQSFCFPISDGTHQTPTYTDDGFIFLSAKNVTSWKIDWENVMHIPESLHNELSKRISPKKNDILLAKNGTIGVAAIVDRDCDFDIYVTLAVLRTINTSILPQYLLNAIASSTVQNEFRGSLKGIGVQNLHLEHIRRTLIPIPPYNEQKLISDKIVEITPLLEHIADTYAEIETAISVLKAKTLDLAIRGKLVPQNPDDEPASVLLERIRAEKEELIKQGKLKRDKKESVIFKGEDNSYYEKIDGFDICIDEKIPFSLPENWRWERLGNISTIARGGSPRPIEDYLTESDDGINWIKIGDTEQGGKYISSTREKIIPAGLSKTHYVKSGDFLLTNSMSFGRPYILKTDGCIHDGWLVIGDIENVFNQDYLYYALSSGFMYKAFSEVAAGSTVKNLKSDTVRAVFFPVPPYDDQVRIANYVEKLFATLASIENSLN